MSTWQRPLQKFRAYRLYTIVVLMGIGFPFGVARVAIAGGAMVAALIAFVAIVIFVLQLRVARNGIYVSDTGVRVITTLRTRTFEWRAIAAFFVDVDNELMVALRSGAYARTEMYRGYSHPRKSVYWLSHRRFDSLMGVLTRELATQMAAAASAPRLATVAPPLDDASAVGKTEPPTAAEPVPDVPAETAGMSYPGQPYPAQWLQPDYPAPWDSQPQQVAPPETVAVPPVAPPYMPAPPQTEFSGRDLFRTSAYAPFPDPFAQAQRTAARRTSRARTVLIIVLMLVVVEAGGVFAASLAWSSHHATASAAPSAPATSPSAQATVSATSPPAYTGDHFRLPATVSGFPRSTNPSLDDDATTAVAAIDQGTEVGPSVVGTYQSRTDQNAAYLLIGMPMRIVDAHRAAVGALADLAANDDYAIGTETTYDAGPRGGVMMCATATAHALTIPWPSSICVVADSGGLIIAMYVTHSGADDATVTTAVRPVFEE